MDFVTPIIDIISRLWNCSASERNYLCELKQNLNSLESSFMKLKDRRDDVKERVHAAESNPMEPAKRTNEVSGWLQRVETLEQEIENLLHEGVKNEGGSYFCCWGRKNCCSGYKLGKIVVEKRNDADKFWNEGVFPVLVDKCQPDVVREIPTNEAVGMDSNLETIWKLVADERSLVRIIGLYGMGGVGKTTLLKNVNNEFLRRTHHYDFVIWVVVSQVLNTEDIQKQIGRSLGLSWSEGKNTYDRSKDIMHVLKDKSFVLLLDDIWRTVDLQDIGIPNVKLTTQEQTKSRVIFTTRSESVCGSMQADETIRVKCLDWDDSWHLFQQNVGQRAISCHPDVFEVAINVAKECLGLPLALITIGQTMASRKTLQEWKYALTVLRKSASEFSGMDEVLPILKFSYDHLQNEKLKSCFLYCSLYPEDYSINKEEIIKLWIGEGFLYEVDDMDDAYNEGHDVIESLKRACLLESGDSKRGNEIKMHDVVRDLAIWIVSDLGRKKGKYLTVQATDKLKLHEWEKAEKISLVGNRGIQELNGAPNCLNLSTLLLHYSRGKTTSDEFFQSMPMLKVLTMSDLSINKLPASLFSLTELQFLDLSCVLNVKNLNPGTFVCLTKLKMLDFFGSGLYNWEAEDGPSLRELESLKDLKYLGINLDTGLALQRLVNSPKFQLCTKRLKLKDCHSMTSLVLSPPSVSSPTTSSSLVSLENMVSLQTLHLKSCRNLKELRIESSVGMNHKVTLFTTLEKFYIKYAENLKIVCYVHQRSTFCFVNLKDVSIKSCPRLKDITWLIYAQNLETLRLRDLDELEEVISDGFAAKEKLINTFSRLNSLVLEDMPKLKRICNPNVKFVSLEHILVKNCSELKKLPFDANSVIQNTLMIEGSEKWW
ncbi:hypothetical protein MKW92_021602 [Papaver armeniacum]|nr:hypothetical protein MKW92_021602 [Papaver armeniacum]